MLYGYSTYHGEDLSGGLVFSGHRIRVAALAAALVALPCMGFAAQVVAGPVAHAAPVTVAPQAEDPGPGDPTDPSPSPSPSPSETLPPTDPSTPPAEEDTTPVEEETFIPEVEEVETVVVPPPSAPAVPAPVVVPPASNSTPTPAPTPPPTQESTSWWADTVVNTNEEKSMNVTAVAALGVSLFLLVGFGVFLGVRYYLAHRTRKRPPVKNTPTSPRTDISDVSWRPAADVRTSAPLVAPISAPPAAAAPAAPTLAAPAPTAAAPAAPVFTTAAPAAAPPAAPAFPAQSAPAAPVADRGPAPVRVGSQPLGAMPLLVPSTSTQPAAPATPPASGPVSVGGRVTQHSAATPEPVRASRAAGAGQGSGLHGFAAPVATGSDLGYDLEATTKRQL